MVVKRKSWNMKETSLESYMKLKDSGDLGEQQKEVLEYYKKLGPITRRELVKRSGMMYNAVCGRTNELLDKNLLEVKGKKKNSDTGKKAEVIGLK